MKNTIAIYPAVGRALPDLHVAIFQLLQQFHVKTLKACRDEML